MKYPIERGSYYTYYKYNGRATTNFACFAEIFGNRRKSVENKVDLLIFIDDFKVKSGVNHLCLLDREEIIEWLDFLKLYTNYSYSIEDKDSHSIWIKMDIKDCYGCLKLLLTCTRNIYEAPNNIVMKEIFACKKLNLIESQDLLDLYYKFGVAYSEIWAIGHVLIPYIRCKLDKKSPEQVRSFLSSSPSLDGLFIYYENETLVSLSNPKVIPYKRLYNVELDEYFTNEEVIKRFEDYHSKNIKIINKARGEEC